MEKNNPLHVKIDTTPSVRKEILESAVIAAQIIKRFDMYKELREKKHDKRLKLIGTMKKIRSGLNTLKNRELPKLPKEVKKSSEPIVKKEKVTKREKPPISELDKEIMEIKNRLHDLED